MHKWGKWCLSPFSPLLNMPKRKYLSEHEFLRGFNLGERKLIFSEESPTISITKPPGTIFVVRESLVAKNSTAGSIYFVREGDSNIPLKIDIYPFQTNKNGPTEIIDEEYKKSKKIKYHHPSEGLPDFMEKQAPNWAVKKTQGVLERLQNYKK